MKKIYLISIIMICLLVGFTIAQLVPALILPKKDESLDIGLSTEQKTILKNNNIEIKTQGNLLTQNNDNKAKIKMCINNNCEMRELITDFNSEKKFCIEWYTKEEQDKGEGFEGSCKTYDEYTYQELLDIKLKENMKQIAKAEVKKIEIEDKKEINIGIKEADLR